MRNIYSVLLGLLALALTTAPFEAHALNNGNFTPMQAVAAYTPTLAGQTDQPGVTYATQEGKYEIVGNFVYVQFNIVTSGTTTKTTTTDNFAVTLPFTSITRTNNYDTLTCDVENGTAVSLGLTGVIGSNTSQVTFNTYSSITAGNASTMTWATTSPGIGVLSHAITARCSGWYEAF